MQKPSKKFRAAGLMTLISVLVLAGASLIISNSITDVMRRELEKSLSTVLVATHNALATWSSQHQELAAIAATTPRLPEMSKALLANSEDLELLRSSPLHEQIRPMFSKLREMTGYMGCSIVSRDNVVLWSMNEAHIGRQGMLHIQPHIAERVWSGVTAISRPMLREISYRNATHKIPIMMVAAPILDPDEGVIATLIFYIDPFADFVPTMAGGRIGESGETYSFDESGMLISASRFEEYLAASGLLGEGQSAMLNIRARDPETFFRGEPTAREHENNPSGIFVSTNFSGEHFVSAMTEYIDYRGEAVVGLWLWEEELDMGLATKLDITQAYSPIRAQQMAIAGFAIVAISLVIAISVIHVNNREKSLAREEGLQQTRRMEALGRMAGGIAHEFNNLLLPIVTLTQLVRKQMPEDFDGKKNLDLVLQAADQGKRIIEQVLDFSRQNPADSRIIALCRIVEESVTLLRETTPGGIYLHFETGDRECLALANATEIRQLVLNLGSNAINALGPKGGHIEFTVHRKIISPNDSGTLEGLAPGHYACLTVKDDGCGMSEATRESAFEPFFSDRQHKGGTGMGLAIVKAIVDGHGGRIDVESTPGSGTIFTVYFPLLEAAEGEAAIPG